MGVVVGLDLGTQGARAVAYGDDGQLLAVADAPHEARFPQAGHAEQDADVWTGSATEVVRQVSGILGARAGDVDALAVAGQVDGVVPLDAALDPIGPALIWLDRRAMDQRQALVDAVGEQRIIAVTGLNPDSSHAAPKLMWLRDVAGARARWYASPTSFLVGWLTGALVQDHANASSSMLYDVSVRDWAPELLIAAGTTTSELPTLCESTDVAGTLDPDVARRLGLPPRCRVAAGTGDDHGAAIAVGATRPGVVVDVSGTAEPVGTTTAEVMIDPQRLVETHAHGVPGRWLLQNPGFVAGGSVMWIARLLGIEQREVFDLAAKAPAGASGLRFLPTLSGAMAPRWNERARGVIAGAAMDHDRSDLCRAVLEGCAFALRDCVDRLDALVGPVDEIRVTGGGARSRLWSEIKASVTGHRVWSSPGHGAATGGGILAAVAAAWVPDVDAAVHLLLETPGESIEPDPAKSDVYADAYGAYRDLYDAVEPTFHGGIA
jgi:xylulokinase